MYDYMTEQYLDQAVAQLAPPPRHFSHLPLYLIDTVSTRAGLRWNWLTLYDQDGDSEGATCLLTDSLKRRRSVKMFCRFAFMNLATVCWC